MLGVQREVVEEELEGLDAEHQEVHREVGVASEIVAVAEEGVDLRVGECHELEDSQEEEEEAETIFLDPVAAFRSKFMVTGKYLGSGGQTGHCSSRLQKNMYNNVTASLRVSYFEEPKTQKHQEFPELGSSI